MNLWTWHEPDFSLTSGRVDHSQSEYFTTVPGVPDSYAELANRVGTDQLIWCYVNRGEYHDLPHLTRVEWELDVPQDGILAITNSFIWNKILGIKIRPPPSLYSQWSDEAERDGRPYYPYIAQKTKEYHSQPEPDGGWWPRLFIADVSAEGATVLLKHPISKSWVVRVTRSRRIRSNIKRF